MNASLECGSGNGRFPRPRSGSAALESGDGSRHSKALALGSDPNKVMAELFGKAPASRKGRAARCTYSTSFGATFVG
jgi:hypothetical protein